MKILILSIFSNNSIYNEMLNVQRKYVHNNTNIDVYFITFDENLEEDVKIIDDFIYVKGKESLINILYKTIKSLNYIINTLNRTYDYIIRTNISTIINFENLLNYLTDCPKINLYIGGKLEILRWSLAQNEISEYKQDQRNAFHELKFIQGIGIILSCDIVNKILSDAHSIEYDIVDDVKLGLIIRDKFPEVYNNIDNIPLARVSYNFSKESVFIRNRTDRTNNSMNDISNMNNQVNTLYNI
jgi:hypothetical protein